MLVRFLVLLVWNAAFFVGSYQAIAQIDPERRNLVQFGYNQPIQGSAPFAAYGYYYHSNPNFRGTNMAFRMAIAPVYLDSELGFRSLLGPNTDVGIGLSGGGFAFNHAEIDRGSWVKGESFTGHGGEINSSIYHTFNPLPDDRTPESLSEVPLQLIARVGLNFSLYNRNSSTAPDFIVPDTLPGGYVRVGLRWGGREPRLNPPRAAELSVWYQGSFRTEYGPYGFDGDRQIEQATHMLLARSLFAYTFPEARQRLEFSITGGAMFDPDRLNVFRIGGTLPMAAEFPLMLPGYYFEELSAERFAVAHLWYSAPLVGRWELLAQAGSAHITFFPGLEQPGNWHTGAGGGLAWTSPSGAWQFITTYAYGINAVRGNGRGDHNIGFIVQYDFDAGKPQTEPDREAARDLIRRINPASWRGFQRFLR